MTVGKLKKLGEFISARFGIKSARGHANKEKVKHASADTSEDGSYLEADEGPVSGIGESKEKRKALKWDSSIIDLGTLKTFKKDVDVDDHAILKDYFVKMDEYFGQKRTEYTAESEPLLYFT